MDGFPIVFITVNVQFTGDTVCGLGLCVCACGCVQAYACCAVSHWSQKVSRFLSQSPASSQSNKEACFKNAWNCHKKRVSL